MATDRKMAQTARFARFVRLSPRVLTSWMTLLGALFAVPLCAEEVVENYASGSVKAKYNVSGGKKNGKYEDFYEDGTPRTRAVYKDDLLNGAYLRYHANGKAHVTAVYKSGKFHGKCVEKSPEGQTIVSGDFVDGVRHGKYVRYIDGKAGAEREYRRGDLVGLNGVVTHPRTRDEIARDLGRIYATRYVYTPKPSPAQRVEPAKTPPEGYPTKEHLEAVQRLNAYRNLCGAPDDVMLDAEQTYYAQAATVLLKKINRLDHTPANPGMPEADYKDAYLGTSSSNLHQGQRSMSSSVDGYMDDSDETNIAHVGHRRWCLNIWQQTTGFGRTDGFSAMWSFDKRRRGAVDWQYVAYPARGYMPVDYFSARHAWSISLNKSLFQQPTASAKAQILPLDGEYKSGEPLALDFENYTVEADVGSGFTVIFRPKDLDMSAGRRYIVELTGIQSRNNKPTSLRYLVDFCEIKPIAPPAKK
jgi:hypothetical protein